ncbi:hypothetical protein [Nocardioides mangrovi]|uniref:Ig-like domain repeat protein n=1 Tax=Nocardioides mangrovi TaxID=2874580 RepID=A0ABS7UIC5_9ACTN|nr:hypothetical protein [Nocardioides mangrovi]MBZ5740398.1 hypothetical protein [Nocardioides mangrovi]
MRTRRLLGTMIASVLTVGTMTLVGTASPASAATATKIVSGTDGKKWIYPGYSSNSKQPGAIVYGTTLSLSINVEDSSGNQVYDGTLTVQRQLPGQAWKTIKTSDSAYYYGSTKAVGNAKYRVLYSGTSDYSPSAAGVSGKVQRKLTYQNVGDRRVVLKGKVSPKYKGKVTVFKKQGKKFKKYKTVRTNKKGGFKTPLPAPRRGKFFWKMEIKSSKTFATTQSGKFYTYSY